jgi:uncharacterized protein (DUF952 family)
MIYHIVKEKEYLTQAEGDCYLPVNMNEFGFVHCALEESVIPVTNDYYLEIEDKLILLKIDPSKLKSETRYEKAVPEKGAGTQHLNSSPIFPHVYGPINNSAVVGIGVLFKGNDGYEWPKEFKSIKEYFNK